MIAAKFLDQFKLRIKAVTNRIDSPKNLLHRTLSKYNINVMDDLLFLTCLYKLPMAMKFACGEETLFIDDYYHAAKYVEPFETPSLF